MPYVLTCSRANVPYMLTCSRANVSSVPKYSRAITSNNKNKFLITCFSVRFEHSVCHGSLMTTYIMLLAQLVEHSLVHWYQQCVTVHQVPKCMSCPRDIVMITGRAHYFHDCICIYQVCINYKLYIICKAYQVVAVVA